MSLRLILGRAGSGKSAFIENEIAAEVAADPLGAPLWVLVPEQATFQVERALCDKLGGLMRVRVVSFQRLAHIVMNEVAGAALTPIGDLGRLMLMRKVIEENKNNLRLFGRAARQPMFAGKVVELVSELKRYRVTPEALSVALSLNLPAALSNKLHDLHLLYSALTEKYGQVSLDSDDRLAWLADHVSSFTPLRGARLYIDGFTSFTPQEACVLGHLFRFMQASLALTLHPSLLDASLDQSHPFFSPWETARQCRQLAVRQGAQVTVQPLYPPEVQGDATPLAYLEANYFDITAKPWEGAAPEISFTAAETRRAEVEFVAREIIALCREQKLRYRDISVAARDLSLYEPLLTEVFSVYDIPFFLDQKRAVPHHPLFDLLTSALEAALLGFPYEPTLRCLKTDLWPLARDVVDRLDNFALAIGARGACWTGEADWHSLQHVSEESLAELNSARREVAAHFAPLADKLKNGTQVRHYAEALISFLSALAVEDRLTQWALSLRSSGDIESARVHSQVWQAVDQLLAELVATLGQEQLPLEDFARVVESGLEGVRLGLIPPCLDQVLVLELGRSRSIATRASFLLGVNDGVLPARQGSPGLLTDEERALLHHSCAIVLGQSAQRQLFEEEFLAYVGLTRAAARLFLSYAQANEDGTALRPSSVMRRLQQLFPAVKLKFAGAEAPLAASEALNYLAHPVSAAGYLAAELRKMRLGGEVSQVWSDVYNCLRADTRSHALVETLARGLRHRVSVQDLPRQLVRRLYGGVLRGSVSRLERFRACPFAHFACYGLKLRERPLYKLAAVDIGNFFHLALDRFVGHMQEKRLDWAEVTREDCRSISQGIVAGLVPQMGILASSARHKYLTERLQRVVERSARAMGEHAKRGKFRPVAVELAFGQDGASLPAVKITLQDGTEMELSGRIDRVDAATAEEKVYAMVVDYKSGANKLTPLEVYYGLKTQLLTYLDVVLRYAPQLFNQAARPAAAVYFRVQDPVLTLPGPLAPAEAEAESQRKFRLEGMVVADQTVVSLLDNTIADRSEIIPVKLSAKGELSGSGLWTEAQLESMLCHLRQSLAEAGEEIMAGRAAVAPFRLDKDTACTYCEFLPVCQFDTLHPDSQYRRLEKHDEATVWNLVCEKGGSGNV